MNNSTSKFEKSPFELLCWAAVVIAAVSMFATPALSEEAFTACLQSQGGKCRLIADTVGIQVNVTDGDATISYFVPAEGGWKIDRVESVNEDMKTQVMAGNISEDDAAFAFAELLSSHDLAYKIPANVSELKRDVGFSPQAVLTPQDQVDVIASNLQMTLKVSAPTADYLVMKLGLQIVDPSEARSVAKEVDPNATAVGADAENVNASITAATAAMDPQAAPPADSTAQ